MQKNKLETILVIRASAMGDVAMTIPVVEQFKQQNPDVRVVFLTSRNFCPFFRYSSGIDLHVAELHGKHKGFMGIIRLFREINKEYKITKVVDLQVKLYSLLLSLLFLLKGIKTTSLDKGKKDKKQIIRKENKVRIQLPKMAFRYAETFTKAGFVFTFKEIAYSRRRESIPALYSFLEGTRLIGFSPMASYVGKQFPLPNVRATIENLIERYPDHKIIVFGGGRYEKMVGESLEGFYQGHVYSTIGKMNIPLEMDLMSNLDVMISMDSSAMHICALLGVPVVSVWGATHPYTGYLGYGYTMDDNAVTLGLDCSPCSVYGNKPCYLAETLKCLHEITPSMIISKMSKYLD